MSDLDFMDDILDPTLTKEAVEARVRDWQSRLHELFGRIGRWALGSGWQVSDGGTVEMNEEPMERFGVPAIEQPTIRLEKDHMYALFRPTGLWVIGANGRIDLYTSKKLCVIIDVADPGKIPRWTIFRASTKLGGDPFEPEMITDLV